MGLLLEDQLRERLEKASAAAGCSVGEEIRRRLERTFDQDADPETSKLLAAIGDFTIWVINYTGHRWHEHRAATRVLRRAILARLTRHWGESIEHAVFAPGEKKSVLVDSDDPDTLGLSLEATHFQLPPMTEERKRELSEQFKRELLERHPEWKKEGDADPSESNT
jgi:hypothetical protein